MLSKSLLYGDVIGSKKGNIFRDVPSSHRKHDAPLALPEQQLLGLLLQNPHERMTVRQATSLKLIYSLTNNCSTYSVVEVSCSPTDVSIMQPSRVADFGALTHSAGFRIEDLANFSTSMSLFS